jgi:hypothetical protein
MDEVEMQTKTASAKMKSAAQQMISDLLEGRMPEGKAGHFKTAAVIPTKKEFLSNLVKARPKLAFASEQPAPQDQPAQQQAPAPAPQIPAANPTSMPATSSAPLQPVNYMGAEQQAQQSQQLNEANFYRERMLHAVQENQSLQQQIAESQATMDQLQQQAASTGIQIQTVTQQALQAQERALEHSQMAAKMRMGMQQMREQMLQIASQDPAAIAEQKAQEASAAAGQAQAQAQQQAVDQQAGTPEASPEATAPGTLAAGGAAQPAGPTAQPDIQPQAKLGSAKAVGRYLKDNAKTIGGGALLGAGAAQGQRALAARKDPDSDEARRPVSAKALGRGAAAGAVALPATMETARLLRKLK